MSKFWRTLFHGPVLAALTVGSYLGLARWQHQTVQGLVVATLILVVTGIEALWFVIRWFSPLGGWFGDVDQEQALLRALERELSRSLRQGWHLTVVGVLGTWRLRLPDVRAKLRLSDIVIRGRGGHLIILMTDTEIEQGQFVMERMAQHLPIRAVALTDEHAVPAGMALVGIGSRYRNQEATADAPTIALLRGLQLGLFRARARRVPGAAAPVVQVGAAAMVQANASATERPLLDLTRRVA
ncbi:MAG: hypothetical protein H0X24_12865 [Ktedonobacterales bacterium]|nr:hypothetical protein [Ktedonobacterales bacterium]